MKRLICFFLGHKWVGLIDTGRKLHQGYICRRCLKKVGQDTTLEDYFGNH